MKKKYLKASSSAPSGLTSSEEAVAPLVVEGEKVALVMKLSSSHSLASDVGGMSHRSINDEPSVKFPTP